MDMAKWKPDGPMRPVMDPEERAFLRGATVLAIRWGLTEREARALFYVLDRVPNATSQLELGVSPVVQAQIHRSILDKFGVLEWAEAEQRIRLEAGLPHSLPTCPKCTSAEVESKHGHRQCSQCLWTECEHRILAWTRKGVFCRACGDEVPDLPVDEVAHG